MNSLHDETLIPEIIFEDVHVIVLSKPSGLLSQSSKAGDFNLVTWTRSHVGRHYVGLIHRLDRETSGLMVLAKRSKAAERLTRSLQSGQIDRHYQAFIHGKLEAPLSLSDWLWKDEDRNFTRIVVPHTPGSKYAQTQINPIQYIPEHNLTLVECILETGRSHQIRAQCAHAGFPLLGDQKYGHPDFYHRVALHSFFLQFPHPMSGELLSFKIPVPKDWNTILGLKT